MKNDFDSFFRSIFPDENKGNVSDAQKEQVRRQMEALERQVAQTVTQTRQELARQTAQLQGEHLRAEALDDVIQDTQAQLEEIRRHLEKDGVAVESVRKEQPAHRLSGFSGLIQAVEPEVIGQEAYLKSLSIAFKRPFVMERDPSGPLGVIMITGPNGSGRHTGIRCMTKELARRGVFSDAGIETLDLSLYGEQDDTGLFLQDLYRALKQKAQVLLLENCESCHPAVRSMAAKLATERTLRLDKRYVEQKGNLVEAGSALTPGAVGALTPAGKYLIFLFRGGWKEEKVADVMGASFLNAMDDRCATSVLSEESLVAIAQKMTEKLKQKANQSLGFVLDEPSKELLAAYLCGAFTVSQGVHGICCALDRCYRALAEYRLREDLPVPSAVSLKGSEPLVVFDGGDVRPLFALLPREYQGELEKVKAELKQIVGLHEVKEYVLALENHYRVIALRKEKGLTAAMPSMHMIFTGNPGTGKTTIARLMARYLKAIGALSGGQLVEVTRADLVGRYVGHTAPLTTQVIQSALGGVLFIDEAYSLYRGEDDSFGLEAIDTLVKGMEDNRDDLVVVLAGYSKEMELFLTANSGLRSRFPNIIVFPDYTAQELLDIARLTVSQKGYRMDDSCAMPLYAFFEHKQTAENSRENGNGRMVRNLVEKAILNQSRRVLLQSESDMELLTLEDFELE